MSDQDITPANYDQLWTELAQLIEAWHDRHGISGRGAAGLFLQYGVTLAYNTRAVTLDELVELVRAQWNVTGNSDRAEVQGKK